MSEECKTTILNPLTEKILSLGHLINDGRLRNTIVNIVNEPRFFTYPASTHVHHAYTGGLAAHTIEVSEFAIEFQKSLPGANLDIIITAALWHDFAKIWDYKISTYFEEQFEEIPKRHVVFQSVEPPYFPVRKTVFVSDFDYKDKVHHISGSMAEFTSAALLEGVDRKLIQRVQHAILAHHGRKDWGTVKDPQTVEAWILHSADYASAHFGPKKNAP